ncbi:MAG: DUF421 domain-containing protein [Clostridia bacterium]|nr:DUF421 domain-containing protein [Clostridia bacterium]
MLTSCFKTVLLLLAVVVSIRLMGKRQIGQLQPAELVVTILLSQVAATPMQDPDIPPLQTLVVIFVLTGAEILLSALAMKSRTVRRLVDGRAITVIRDGEIDQKQLARLRYTVDDVFEALRQKDVFDLADVDTAVAETNGTISVLLKEKAQAATKADVVKNTKKDGMPQILIADGRLSHGGMKALGWKTQDVQRVLDKERVGLRDVFLLTATAGGKTLLVKKEGAV